MRDSDAERLLRFARTARPTAATVVAVTKPGVVRGAGRDVDVADARRRHADRIVRHWRTEIAPLSALPGFAGRFGGPVRDVLAATVQGLLVLSLAELCEVDDDVTRVRLVAQMVLDEELPPGWRPTQPTADFLTADLPEANPDGSSGHPFGPASGADPGSDSDEEPESWQQLLRKVPVGTVTLAREIWAVRRLIGKREEGRLWHRAVANVPAVGLFGATLGERHAAVEIASRAYVALGLASDLPGI